MKDSCVYKNLKTIAISNIIAALILAVSPIYAQTSPAVPQNPKEDLFKKAEKYFFQKKIEMAEIMLQEVIRKNPENDKAYSYLGDIFLQKKRYDGALNLYQKSLDLNPDNAENYFRKGQIFYYKKLGKIAIENYQKSVDLDKKMKFAYYHIGLSYLMLERDKSKTIQNWETYLTLAPEDPQYESIRRVIELLKDPAFELPSIDSDITIEEALLLGGATLKKAEHKAKDKQAGDEKKKTKQKIEGIYLDDDL